MSLNPAHVIVVCLVLVVAQLGVVAVCRALVAVALGLQRILLFAGIVAAGLAVFAIAAARTTTDTAAPTSRPAVVTVAETRSLFPATHNAEVLSFADRPVLLSAEQRKFEAEPGGASVPRSMPDDSAGGGVFAVFLISFLILAVALSQLLSAVLPILIIVLLVPAQERAALADLIAALGSNSKFGVRSAVRAVMAARKRKAATGDDHRG
jgi:hypothetical protein